jgi:serine-type D-Ala-D-Ala carboxypeptidase/endopeptidase (penicillin-binding protein 4)
MKIITLTPIKKMDMRLQRSVMMIGLLAIGVYSCTPGRHIQKKARVLIEDSALLNAHLGISIFDPASQKYLYNYQGDKFFIPASNTKIFTCYAAMRYLGDSLTALEYDENDTAVVLRFTGDPTLLHPDFVQHPALRFLQTQTKPLIADTPLYWKEKALGYGWAWDDYNDDYMAETSVLPIYGNLASFALQPLEFTGPFSANARFTVIPRALQSLADASLVLPVQRRTPALLADTAKAHAALRRFSLLRSRVQNQFTIEWGGPEFTATDIPFATHGWQTALHILQQDFGISIRVSPPANDSAPMNTALNKPMRRIKSQPTDSVLKLMMHRSDNFYADQLLLMTAYTQCRQVKTSTITDTLLRRDLADLSQRPRWVDGSGLSRYNLFTPQHFVQVLEKMRVQFGFSRLQQLFPTGGTGTLGSYYNNFKNRIFVKTGTLSNNCALSGFIQTKKGKWLIFSVLANHYPSGATPVRRAVERFLTQVANTN